VFIDNFTKVLIIINNYSRCSKWSPSAGMRNSVINFIRTTYCQWLLRQHINDAAFVTRLLATYESEITRDGIFNYHNSHLWAENNPHARHVANHQHHFSINAGWNDRGRILRVFQNTRQAYRCIISALTARLTTHWRILTYEHANKCGFFTMELLHTSLLMSGPFWTPVFLNGGLGVVDQNMAT
jgi:hypothetical protein